MAFSSGEPVAYATGSPTIGSRSAVPSRPAPTANQGFRRPKAARTASGLMLARDRWPGQPVSCPCRIGRLGTYGHLGARSEVGCEGPHRFSCFGLSLGFLGGVLIDLFEKVRALAATHFSMADGRVCFQCRARFLKDKLEFGRKSIRRSAPRDRVNYLLTLISLPRRRNHAYF